MQVLNAHTRLKPIKTIKTSKKATVAPFCGDQSQLNNTRDHQSIFRYCELWKHFAGIVIQASSLVLRGYFGIFGVCQSPCGDPRM